METLVYGRNIWLGTLLERVTCYLIMPSKEKYHGGGELLVSH